MAIGIPLCYSGWLVYGSAKQQQAAQEELNMAISGG
jgi:hypothetical protein